IYVTSLNHILNFLHFTCLFFVIFFFSSRRRHTISVSAFLLNRSSDLSKTFGLLSLRRKRSSPNVFEMAATETITSIILIKLIRRSEERRVGKEWRYMWLLDV